MKSSRSLLQIIFVFLTITIMSVSFESKGADCISSLNGMISLASGIPSERIGEFENCVQSLEGRNDAGDIALLRNCYAKLIAYYDALDNQVKVKFYRDKLDALPK